MATVRKEWPRFEKFTICSSKLNYTRSNIRAMKTITSRCWTGSDDIKEDDYEGNLEIVTQAKNFMKKDPFYVGGLKYQPDSFVATLLQNKPKFDDPHEELNQKRKIEA